MSATIIVNFKTYEEATGTRAEKLADIMEKVGRKTGADMIAAVQNTDVFRVARSSKLRVFAQHADPEGFGAHTGKSLPGALKENGAAGVLINHSEDRMHLPEVAKLVERCKSIGLKTLVCVESVGKARDVMEMGPDYIAFESPELIGTMKSISTEKPDSIRRFAGVVSAYNAKSGSRIIPLCGAGISSGKDVAASMGLGMKGVLVASAVVRAKSQEKALMDLCGMGR